MDHQIGRSVQCWDACVPNSQTLAIVSLERLNIAVEHLGISDHREVAGSTDSLTCRCAGILVLFTPRVVDQARGRRQHLAPRVEQWIIELRADLHRTLDCNDSSAGIDKTIRADKSIQGADLSFFQAGVSCASGLRLVSLRALCHRTE